MLSFINVILAVAAISLLIFVHELGHFIMAKAVGMRVETFSLGFGPKLFGFRRGDTLYQLAVIPLGGYVKVTGESPDEGGGEPHEFWSKTPGQRSLFVVGGVVMNFVLALILFVAAFAIGVPFTAGRAGAIEPGSPAWEAGIQSGDRIVQINNVENPTFEEISREIILGDYDWTRAMPWLLAAGVFGLLAAFPVLGQKTRGHAETPDESDGDGPEVGPGRIGRQLAAFGVGAAVLLLIFGVLKGVQPRDPQVRIVVERDGQAHEFMVAPEHDEELGINRVGIAPPVELLVMGFHMQEGFTDSPAKAAGMELGDRVVALGGKPLAAHYDLIDRLANYPDGPIPLTVLRDGKEIEVSVDAQPITAERKGFSCVGNRVEALAAGGPADLAGMEIGDIIQSVNGQPVYGAVGLEEALAAVVPGTAVLTVDREGQYIAREVSLPEQAIRVRLLDSMEFFSGTTVTWVGDGSPAADAGLKVGDSILSVNAEKVESWRDVLEASASNGDAPDLLVWLHDGETVEAVIPSAEVPVEDRRFLGIEFKMAETRVRESVGGAVVTGVRSTFRTLGEIVTTISGMATRDVGAKNMGGIITISRVSYVAAMQGIGKLLYMTAIISASLAFLNILPIPVLDGGHLVFLAVEKVRGRRLSERTMAMLQSVGFVALILLVIFVTWNDIMRLMAS